MAINFGTSLTIGVVGGIGAGLAADHVKPDGAEIPLRGAKPLAYGATALAVAGAGGFSVLSAIDGNLVGYQNFATSHPRAVAAVGVGAMLAGTTALLLPIARGTDG